MRWSGTSSRPLEGADVRIGHGLSGKRDAGVRAGNLGGKYPQVAGRTVLLGRKLTGWGCVVPYCPVPPNPRLCRRIESVIREAGYQTVQVQWGRKPKIGEDMREKVSFDDEPLYSLMKMTTK